MRTDSAFSQAGRLLTGLSRREAPGAAAPQTAADAAVPLLHTATLHVVRLVGEHSAAVLCPAKSLTPAPPLADGVVCDRRQFAEDFLSLSQNACVSACGDVLTGTAPRALCRAPTALSDVCYLYDFP